MKITGLRPVSVTAFPEEVSLPGYLPGSGMSRPCPSLIRMSNGGVMRNLCGATTGDYHTGKRIWGTRASAENIGGHGLRLRIGASGNGLVVPVEPEWPAELGKLAENAGHGGGDFWELYYFAREILTGEPAPWTIGDACDVTLAGIMAVRSHGSGGQPMEIPDFRDGAVRDRYRNDHRSMRKPFDPARIFPEGHDPAVTSAFNGLMIRLSRQGTMLRTAMDGAAVAPQIQSAEAKLEIVRRLHQAIGSLPEMERTRREAEELVRRYPGCPAADALRGMMSLAEPELENGIGPAEEKLRAALDRMLAP